MSNKLLILGQALPEKPVHIIMPVGKLAIISLLNQNGVELHEFIGREYRIEPFDCGNKEAVIIPLPHPSGLSIWSFKDRNKELLKQALEYIKANFDQ